MSLALAACDVNGFFLGADGFDGDGGVILDGDGNPIGDGDGGGGGGFDAGPDAAPPCVPTQEVCDEVDNDCDNMIDEGFNTDADPENCGACGVVCSKPGTNGTCDTGTCAYECLSGFIDLDMNIDTNGCEYLCTPTVTDETGTACDVTDNDCDGTVDEHIDFTTDIDNCGSCGNLCRYTNAADVCAPTGGDPVGACEQGACDCNTTTCYQSLNAAIPGCEYLCPVPPTSVTDGVPTFMAEVCNGKDDDCDGKVDEELSFFDTLGNPTDVDTGNVCHPYYTDGNGATNAKIGEGICVTGTWQCNGTLQCVGAVTAAVADNADFCGGGDEDCSGAVDEDSATAVLTDPFNCGTTPALGCGNACDLQNTSTHLCVAGECQADVCDDGWTLGGDGDPSAGCDYKCTPSGAEVCDGKDNDCDELTDLADTNTPPTNPGAGLCRNIGACDDSGTVTPVCGVPGSAADGSDDVGRGDLSMLPTCGGAGWYCPYDTGAGIEVDPATCNVVGQETECDAFDNDCDGVADEYWPTLGDTCYDDGLGICRDTGIVKCKDVVDGIDESECDLTELPDAEDPLTVELCNNKDDNCDGIVDNLGYVEEEMVAIDFTPDTGTCTIDTNCTDGSGNITGWCTDGTTCRLWMDQYEASRPDATASSPGTVTTLSCSEPNRIPWALVSHATAESACVANGKRLCTQEEWRLGCGGDGTGPAQSCTVANELDPYTANDCLEDVEFCNDDQDPGGTGFCAYKFPYATAYDPFACNGGAWNSSCLPAGADTEEAVHQTGDLYSPGGSSGDCPADTTCMSSFSAMDMSGNLREWTSTPDQTSYEVRGGSFTEGAGPGVSCDNTFIALDPALSFNNLGFRCCRDTPRDPLPAP